MVSATLIRTLFTLAIAGVVQAQSNSSSSGTGKYIDSSVAWGVAGRIPVLPVAGPNSRNATTNPNMNDTDYHQLLYSVNDPGAYDGNASAVLSLLAKPGTQFPNESTSFYSYCFIKMYLGSNNLRLAQTDDGTCHQTFGADCAGNLTQAVSQKAAEAYRLGNRQYEICTAIVDDSHGFARHPIVQTLQDFFTSEPSCRARRSSDPPAAGYAGNALGYLPGDSEYGVSQTLFPGYGLYSFSGAGFEGGFPLESFDGFYDNDPNQAYETLYRSVFPIIAVVIPNVDPGSIPPSVSMGAFNVFDAYMACARVTNRTANATIPKALPAGSDNAAGSIGQLAGRTSFLGALLCITLLSLL